MDGNRQIGERGKREGIKVRKDRDGIIFSRAGNSLIGFLSKLLVFCKKMSQ